MLQAYRPLVSWATSEGISLSKAFSTPKGANSVLVCYIQSLYNRGGSFADAKYAILHTQTTHRHLKGKLARAWDSVKSWSLEVPCTNRLPLPFFLLEVLFYTCVSQAYAHKRHSPVLSLKFASFGILLLLGFHGLLRPGELLHLRVADILVPSTPNSPLIIAIRRPKTRLAFGRIQHVLVQDPKTIAWTSWLLSSWPKNRQLWPFSIASARSLFRQLLRQRQLSDSKLLISSLRPGGATHLYTAGLSVEQLQFKGRWKCIGTLRSYIQEATAAMVLLQLDPVKVAALTVFCDSCRFLDRPPPVPFK